jgi:hypothetical protein
MSIFTPYTLSYSELLHITCDCAGDFCAMVDQTVTAMFQNLQLSSLAQVRCGAVRWGCGVAPIAPPLVAAALQQPLQPLQLEQQCGRSARAVVL